MAAGRNAGLYTAGLILAVFVGISFSLRCYQCVDSGDDSDCRNASLLLNVTNKDYKGDTGSGDTWKRNRYFKSCKENITMCMIETYTSQDGAKSFHRDCTDGETFSFDTVKFSRLKNLLPNNETTCTYDSTGFGQHICLRLCKGDMCNGPELIEESDCRNETNEFGVIYEVCGESSSPTHVFIYGVVVPFTVYFCVH